MASSRDAIQNALKARLETILVSNGYDLSVKKVYADDIPLGMELEPQELPAIIIVDDNDEPRHEHKKLDMSWLFRLQLCLVRTTDAEVRNFQRAVGKAIWANHPTAEIDTAFRITPQVYWIQLGTISSDLNMLESNRVSEIEIIVHHRRRLFDL